MKKKVYRMRQAAAFAFGVITLLIWLSSTQLGATEGVEPSGPPDTLTIDIQTKCPFLDNLPKDVKQVKDFSHAKHAREYLVGNSEYASVPYGDDFTCAACHAETISEESLLNEIVCERIVEQFESAGGIKEFKKRYHDACKGCHEKMEKAGKATGPTKCKGCHKKE